MTRAGWGLTHQPAPDASDNIRAGPQLFETANVPSGRGLVTLWNLNPAAEFRQMALFQSISHRANNRPPIPTAEHIRTI